MYRQQFPYTPLTGALLSPPVPDAFCEEHRCHYSFDGSNTAALLSVAAGAVLTKIPLRMDQDAPFFLRAIQATNTGLLIRLEDCFENPLLPERSTMDAALWLATGGAGLVPLESDEWGIFCPAGGVLLLYVTNPTVSDVTTFVLTLHGVKLYQGGPCS